MQKECKLLGCPKRPSSPQFPSPTDCLPEGELEELLGRIEEANELLLDLALEDGRPSDEVFRGAFDGLFGRHVEVATLEDESIKGTVKLAGFDFTLLEDGKESAVLLPYGQIREISLAGCAASPPPVPGLIGTDVCLRSSLVSCFGATVSSSPELIHLFFRMRLPVYLLTLEGSRLEITVDHNRMEGLLTDVNRETIVLKTGKERKIIPIGHITLVRVKP
ncbi:hypothetical protein [Bhargavaea cecembensis]|uniref:hypothetical protein n=1 Tax=Bhargavaea cecembensis TaxID=394098 RepID=UPI0006944EF7|nr:hypothetical protein [Bhargavaea cecembensis]